MKYRSLRSNETLAVALRKPSLGGKQHGQWQGQSEGRVHENSRFAQIFVPGNITDVWHSDTIEN